MEPAPNKSDGIDTCLTRTASGSEFRPKISRRIIYRLLGVEAFEDDLDVIEGAADRQMAFVRQYQSGEHSADAAKILNELAIAWLCLLKPATKSAYDEKLRTALAAANPEPVADFLDLPFTDLDLKTERLPALKRAKPGKAKSSGLSMPLMIGGGVVAAVCLMLILFLFRGRSQQPVHNQTETVQVAAVITAKTTIPEPTQTNDTQPKTTELSAQEDAPLIPAQIRTMQIEATENDAAIANIPATPTDQQSTSAAQTFSRPKEGEWVDLLEWAEGVDWAPRGINWNESLEGEADAEWNYAEAPSKCNRFPLAAVIDGDYES